MNNYQGSKTIQEINDFVGCQSAAKPLMERAGYVIFFDGYFGNPYSPSLVGRWIAGRRGMRNSVIVSICGGTVQMVGHGEAFEISNVDVDMTDAIGGMDEFVRLKHKALDDLIEYLDKLPVMDTGVVE